MPNKPIIDIEIDDAQFQKFAAAFSDYKKGVEDSNEAWKKLDRLMSGYLDHMTGGLKRGVKAQEEFRSATNQSHKAMKSLVGEAKALSGHIFGIGKFLFKIGAIGSIFGGLSGLLGLGLADAATQRQRSARGFGLSPGQLASFQTHLGPFVNTTGLLETSANLPFDLAKRPWLSALFRNPNRILQEGTLQRSFDILNRVQEIVKKGIPLAQSAQGRAFAELGISMDEQRRLRATGRGTLLGAERAVGRDVGVLGFSDPVAREWRNLSVQLHKMGVELESILITGLAPLAPEFRKFSIWLTREFVSFARSGGFRRVVNELVSGFRKMEDVLGSKSFQDDMRKFGTAMVDVTDAIVWTAKKLSWISDSGTKKSTWTTFGNDLSWWLKGGIFGHDTVKAYPPNAQERSRMGKSHVHVTVTNHTGSDIHTSANAASP